MKNLSLLLLVTVFSLGHFAEVASAQGQGRHGVQFGSGNVEYIYYGNNFAYAVGLTAGHESNDAAGFETKETTLGVFARYNIEISEKLYFGAGVFGDYIFGKKNGIDINSSYRVGPYLILDYHLSDHIIINGGVVLVQYEWEKLEASEGVTKYSYLPTFLALTYLF